MARNIKIPQKIKVKNADNSITFISYHELKEHEENRIMENVAFGKFTGADSETIDNYIETAQQEWIQLRHQVINNPDIILVLDEITEGYVPFSSGAEIIDFPQK